VATAHNIRVPRASAAANERVPTMLVGGLRRLAGWRLNIAAALLGALAAGALPPLHVLPLLWVAFTGLALLSYAQTPRRAFVTGFWFGLGHFVAGLYWLAWPLTLDLARFGWMIPFAVFGISALLALFPAAATTVAAAARLRGVAHVLALAAAWGAAEWLRGHLLTGFSWNLIATSWTAVTAMLQPAAYVGAYGLGAITVLLAAVPFVLFDRSEPAWPRLLAVGGSLVALALLFVGGEARLAAASAESVAGVRLRLVQGNIPQSLKWVEGRREHTLALYLSLTRAPGFEHITHVVWPETAIDYRFETAFPAVRLEGERLARFATAVPSGGALLTGAIRDSGGEWFNSLHVVAAGARLVATYDKHHLVPFGEYVPFRSLLRRLGVEQLAHGTGDYSAGAGLATLDVPGAPSMSPLVCYEAIFPGHAVGARRPGWLLNVTNDAWFGFTSGPFQHLSAARLRAVEEGLPLVRAANTGITAVVDAYGRMLARLPLMERAFLDAPLPSARAAPTIYARLGDRSLLLLLLVFSAVALAFDRRAIRDREPRLRG
jgi:apolipoprotein N-acyltransferase